MKKIFVLIFWGLSFVANSQDTLIVTTKNILFKNNTSVFVPSDSAINFFLKPPTYQSTYIEFISSDGNTYMGVVERLGSGPSTSMFNSNSNGSESVEIRLDVPGGSGPYQYGTGMFIIDYRNIKKGIELIDGDGNTITNYSGFKPGTLVPKAYVDALIAQLAQRIYNLEHPH